MALFPTNVAQVQAFAGALYGVQVGSTTMKQVEGDISAQGGLTNALNYYYTASFGSEPPLNVAKRLVDNIGISAANKVDAEVYVTGVLSGTKVDARGAAIMDILNLLSRLTADPKFRIDADNWNTKVATAVAYTGSSNVGFGTVGSEGSTFTLTASAATVDEGGDLVFQSP